GIGLRQALFRADKWANYEKAVLAGQANDIQLLQQHQQLIEQISKAYLNVLRAEAMTDSLNAEFTALKAQNDMMQARLAQGVAARVDTEESRARLESVSASIANNDVAIVNAKQQLSLLTGQPINQLDAIKLPPNLNLVASQSIENWMQQSQNNNLDIQLAQTQVAIANKQVDYLKANLYPRVDLVGNVGWQDYTHNNQSAIDGTNYSFGVEVDFPFYTGGRTRAGVEQGNLQAQAAKSRLAYVYQAAMTQTSQAYLNLVAQRATIKAQQVAVDANRRVAQASKTGYDLGVRSMVDTLLAERQYHAAKRDLINAYFDYLNAYIDLQKAAGNLTDDTVKVLDNQLI
nr:TolC family protein [Moraxella sp.]